MDDYFLLILLSFAMFFGSYIAGSLPLVVSFTESKLRLVTILGAGLLVGTALAVIIPEGVHSVYTAQKEESHQLAFAPSLVVESPAARLSGEQRPISPVVALKPEKIAQKRSPKNGESMGLVETLPEKTKDSDTSREVDDVGVVKRTKRDLAYAANGVAPKVGVELTKGHDHKSENAARHEHGFEPKTDVHHVVGVALVAGFVLMLLVDQLAQSRMSRVDVESGVIVQQPRYKITATIGLVVHAAADGVALGAASGSSHNDIQFIVFLAIMLHKAPASFGLVTFLLHEGLDKGKIRRHLLIFSLSAPLAALATFVFVTKGGSESLASLNSAGVLLLFSAGTFLYVATVHVLPEVTSGHSHGSSGSAAAGGLRFVELLALILGAVLPTVLTVGHSH